MSTIKEIPYMQPEKYCYWCNRHRSTIVEKEYKCDECCQAFAFLDKKKEIPPTLVKKKVQNYSYDDIEIDDGHHLSHGHHSGW
tara:strand:- start:436 stop:684 length:249 start_codon:yes stop_codon:yes gene_type:complete